MGIKHGKWFGEQIMGCFLKTEEKYLIQTKWFSPSISLFFFNILYDCHLCFGSFSYWQPLFFSFFSLLNTTYQSIQTFNIRGVLCFCFFLLFWSKCSVLFLFPFFLLPFFLRSNECGNLQGKMLSSRAFNCWTKYESLSLFPTWCSHWDTVTKTAGLLSKEIAVRTIRTRILVCRVLQSVDNCCKFVITAGKYLSNLLCKN